MFNTEIKKKRTVGLILLVVLLGLFLWFNRIPKLDTVAEDLVAVTAPVAECFQGFCIDEPPGSTFLSRWWDFSLTYLELVTLGMIFAFLIAGLTEVFLFPPGGAQTSWSDRGLKGSLKGLLVGPAMNLCSACIVPVSSAFRRRGAGIETTLAIVQGSATLNLPALIMVALVFTPMLGASRVTLSLIGALLLGPLVARLLKQQEQLLPESLPETGQQDAGQTSWIEVLTKGSRDWLIASLRYLVRLGPIMVLAGFASAFAIQWVSPDTVGTFLGNNAMGVAIAATLGILINVPLLFEVPLVAALLLVGMGTGPAATLLFVAAAGGPITFWGLVKVMPKKAVLTFATATWGLGAIGGLGVLALSPLLDSDASNLRTSVTSTSGMEDHLQDLNASIQPVDFNYWSPVFSNVNEGVGIVSSVPVSPVASSVGDIADAPVSGMCDLSWPSMKFSSGEIEGRASPISFQEMAATMGVDFHHIRDDFRFNLGGGAAIGDYDGDELLDIYVTNSAGANALYRNSGNSTFTDVAAAAGVENSEGRGYGAGWGDYDSDGDLDLFVANFGGSKLYRNNGDGTFTDVTTEAGVGDPDAEFPTMGITWGDYNQDGYIDLLVVRHIYQPDFNPPRDRDFPKVARPLALYRNNGDGTFTNVTSLLGDSSIHPSNVKGAGFKPTFLDYDNDGDPDIYVVNDFGQENYTNVLWRNDGSDGKGGWKFTDVSTASGANLSIYGMGLAVGDYDNDSDLDFSISNIADSVFLENQGDGTFVNVTERTGTGRGVVPGNGIIDRSTGWGTIFVDLDNNGLLDLYYVAGQIDSDPYTNPEQQPNAIFINNGDGTFFDISALSFGDNSSGDDSGIGREVAAADFNNDGLMDLFVVNMGKVDGTPGVARLLINTSDTTNNWLSIKLIGTTSNRDGLGARITVTCGGVRQIREMGASQGHVSHSVVPVHFGLGSATQADVVEIRWPSGTVQTLTDVPANQVLSVTEP